MYSYSQNIRNVKKNWKLTILLTRWDICLKNLINCFLLEENYFVHLFLLARTDEVRTETILGESTFLKVPIRSKSFPKNSNKKSNFTLYEPQKNQEVSMKY